MDVKVGDLVSLPSIRTVVQLGDARDASLRTSLVEQFVLTEEASFGLQVILGQILQGQGGGFFLKGNYGSGKSHFLAYLSLILSETGFLQTFLSRFGQRNAREARNLEPLADLGLAVARVSLVEHRGSQNLEDIVTAALAEHVPGLEAAAGGWAGLLGPHADRLDEHLRRKKLDRRQFWASEEEKEAFARRLGIAPPSESRRLHFDRAFAALAERGLQGLVILVDELSEFLRSKPSIRRFNEDIRYLQFLGEFSMDRPLWVVAALQEHIEETGEIRQEVFNKIKDRYPIRLSLTAAHVKSLVGEFLVRKKPEATAILEGLHARYLRSFPSWTVSKAEFCDLYPIHPASIDLLEDLKPLFSKTRGFVDFIHHQVKGDPDRGISGLLREPCESLLCPDRIFDHFQDRLSGNLQTLPYVETVYAHYRKEMKRLFEEAQDQRFALRLVKLLILQQASPVRRNFTVRELTEMLLERITDLDPSANYDYTADIADKLVLKGGFLVASVEAERDRSLRTYSIEFESSVSFLVERKLRHLRQTLAPQGGRNLIRLFSSLLADMPFFQQVSAGRSEVLMLEWQNTRRLGALAIPSQHGELEEGDGTERLADFRLAVLLPGQPFALGPPLLDGPAPCSGVLVPAEIEDADSCLQAMALVQLREDSREDDSAQGRRIRARIDDLLREQLPRVESVFEKAYCGGVLRDPGGQIVFQFRNQPAGSFRLLLEAAAAKLLEFRFPKHYLIAPLQTYYPQAALEELAQYCRSMSPEAFAKMGWGRTVVEGFLGPVGLLKRKGKEYAFVAEHSECGPLKMLLDLLRREGEVSGRRAFEELAHSDFGISELQFRAFLWAVLLGGFVAATRAGRKVPWSQLDPARTLEIEGLRLAETLSPQAAAFARRLEGVPKKLRKASLSYAECQQCWDSALQLARDTEKKRAEVEQLLGRYRDYRVFELLDPRHSKTALARAGEFVAAVRLSAPAVDGLETLAREGGDPEELNQSLKRLGCAHTFFADAFSAFSFMASFLQKALTAVPRQPRYQPLWEDLEKLWAAFQQFDPTGPPAVFQKLQEGFHAWQQLYAGLYEEEHRLYYHRVADSPLQDFLRGPHLTALSRLERLDALVCDQSSAHLREEVQQALGSACGRSVWEELQQRPTCACGFELGRSAAAARAEPLVEKAGSQLRLMVAQIQHPRFRELLDRFEFHLSRRGEEGFLETVRRLKQVGTEEELLQAADLVDSAFTTRLNSFEPDRKPFEIKSLSDFRRRIGKNPKTWRGLASEFEAWLKEGLNDPEQPIRLIERQSEEEDAVDRAFNSLLRHSPAEIRESHQRLNRDEFHWRLLAAHLVDFHGLDPESSRQRLPLLPPADQVTQWGAFASAALETPGVALAEAIEAFEGELGESGYESLGLFADDEESLFHLVRKGGHFPQMIRWATLRLCKRLSHGGRGPAPIGPSDLEAVPAQLLSAGSGGPAADCRHLAAAWFWLLQARRKIGEALHQKAGKSPSLKTWERHFAETLALVPWVVDAQAALARHLDLSASLDSAAAEGLLRQLQECLQSYGARLKESSEKLLRIERTLQTELPALMEELDASAVRLLYADALSWPLWKLLAARLQKQLPPHVRIVAERIAYARQPSNTVEQVSRWLAAGGPQVGKTVQKGFSFFQAAEGGAAFKLDWIDEKIHTSRESPFFLFREIVEQLSAQLLGILSNLPRKSILVLFSDHGFVENPAFDASDKYRRPRYRHGGGSPFELAVPLVFFFSGTAGHDPAAAMRREPEEV